MDQTDSLEDWVAIKEHPFLDNSSKTRLDFHVAWNAIECKAAVTCHSHSRIVSDQATEGWSGAFTFNDIYSIHQQLALVHPSLGPFLPELPLEPRGLWAYISNTEPPDDNICGELQTYFKIALDICGQKLFVSTLFEEHSYEEYFENIGELKRRVYDEAVINAKDQLQNILFLRCGSINLLDMMEVYSQEDEALFKLNIALAQLYNYLLQPFLDMRELSFGKLREAKTGLSNPALGARRKCEYADLFAEWHENYVHALDRIQEMYIEYYSQTLEILEACLSRMNEDKKRFGKSSFEAVAQERLNRTAEDLSLERLQLLRATMKQYEHQRDKVQQQIATLEERPDGVKQELLQLEKEVYDWQVRVYDIQLQVLDEEGALLQKQIKVICQEYEAAANEVQFYDAVEDMEELSSDEESSNKLNPQERELKTKLSTIHRKRAQIRNKRKTFVNTRQTQIQKKKEQQNRMKQHHSIQIKRDEQKAKVNEKEDFRKEERQKTLARLRQYKMKYPSPATIRPLRYQQVGGKKGSPTSPGPTFLGSTSSQSFGGHHGDCPDGKTDMSLANNHITEMCGSADSSSPHLDIPLPPPPPCLPPIIQNQALPPPLPPTKVPSIPPPPPPFPPPGSSKRLEQSSDLPRFDKKIADETSSGGQLFDMSALKDGRSKLKTHSETSARPDASADHMQDMTGVMHLIRQGVKLRPVSGENRARPPSNKHAQEIQDVLDRIKKKFNQSTQEEEEEEDSDDWH